MDSKANYRNFIVRLKKISENPDSHITKNAKNAQRFVLADKMRVRIVKAKKLGKEITIKILSTEATTKPKAKKAKKAKVVKAKKVT